MMSFVTEAFVKLAVITVYVVVLWCIYAEQSVDDAVAKATSSCLLTDEPLVQLDNNVVSSDLSSSLPATQVILCHTP